MAGGGVSYVVYTSYLVRRAPVLEDVPHDAVVAEPREEVQDGVIRRQLAALGEAADGDAITLSRFASWAASPISSGIIATRRWLLARLVELKPSRGYPPTGSGPAVA